MTFRTAIETDQILVDQSSDLCSKQTAGGNTKKNTQQRPCGSSDCDPCRTESASDTGTLNHTGNYTCSSRDNSDCGSEIAGAMYGIGRGGTVRTKDFHHHFFLSVLNRKPATEAAGVHEYSAVCTTSGRGRTMG